MTNLDSILKSKDITLLTRVHVIKAMAFSVVIYGYESWTLKKAERQRIDAFELWCWKRVGSPLDCKEIKPIHPKGNQSWIFIGRTDSEAEAQYFGQLMRRANLSEKILMLGKIGGRRRRRWQRTRWLASLTQWTWVWASSRRWWRTGKPGVLQSMGLQRIRHDWATELIWTEK